MTGRPRSVDVAPFPVRRRFVTAALRRGRKTSPMYGLLDLDVTAPQARLAAMRPPGSMTAFVVACVARAAAASPEVHAYRDWRGRLVTHRYVDVTTLIEVETPTGVFPLAHVVRDADVRRVADIGAELHSVKRDPETSGSGRLLGRLAPVVGRLPGLARLLYLVIARSPRARRRTGTITVTAVGMFAGGGGFAFGAPTVFSLGVLVGGMSARPRVVDGEVAVRNVLDISLMIDHTVVDGAPAARFGAELRRLVESGSPLD